MLYPRGMALLWQLWRQVHLALRLLKDSRVPIWPKSLFSLGLIYLLSPLDLIPDFSLPLLGHLDDLVIFLISVKGFIALCPRRVVQEYLGN